VARARRQAMRGGCGRRCGRSSASRVTRGRGRANRRQSGPGSAAGKLSAPGCILGPPLPVARCPHAGVTAVGSAPSVGPHTPRRGEHAAGLTGSATNAPPLVVRERLRSPSKIYALKARRWRRRPHRERHALVLTCGSSRVGRAQSRSRQGAAAVTDQRFSSSVREPDAMSPRSCVRRRQVVCSPQFVARRRLRPLGRRGYRKRGALQQCRRPSRGDRFPSRACRRTGSR
jgi:hypothetical protein